MEREYVMVTNYEEVDVDDFYLSDEWKDNVNDIDKLRELAKDGKLYYAYTVAALDYCVYGQMNAHQILINEDDEELASCESIIIGNKHDTVISYKL